MIPGLDGLRAIALLLVFFVHTDHLLIGWTGVQLFFVLSGFLITDILLRMKETLPVKAYFAKFYGRRFLRIFPLYYFYLVLMLIITGILLANHYRPEYMRMYQEQVKFGFLYVYNFFNASAWFEESKFIGHFWSLSVEEQFYIFWPLIILLTPSQHLKKVFIFFIALGPLSRFGLAVLFNRHVFDFLYFDTPVGIYVLPFSHLDAFALGAYITRFNFPRPRLQLLLLSISLPVIGFASQYFIDGKIVTTPLVELTSLGFRFPLANGLKHVWGYSLLNYFFAMLIYCVVRERMFVKFLEKRFLSYLGKISYGLYVYHYAVIWLVVRTREFWNITSDTLSPVFVENLNKAIVALFSFALTLLIASASYHWMEKPLLELKDRFFALKPARRKESSP